jgi:diguanylate cyclase (GGDEF)-like protein/putative nucleotidyltransferase with HDIG domain
MSMRARLFIALTAAAGIGFMVQAGMQWESTGTARFLFYVTAALLASTLTVRLPGVSATRWLSSLLVIVGLLELSYSETMIMACAATLVQNFWESKRKLPPGHTLFNLCNVTAVAVGLTYCSYLASGRFVLYSSTLTLTIAASVYFVSTTAIPVILNRLTQRDSDSQQSAPDWYFWTFPYYLVGTAVAGILELVNRQMSWQLALLALPVLYATHRSYRMYLNRLEEDKHQVEMMAALHLRTIEALALAIDAKHQTTREHLNRMCAYSMEIGKALGISQKELTALQTAALLHDVGNLAVPEHIMNKPGKLTAEEFEKVKIHPTVGAEILEQVRFPYPVVPIVRAHHERWDGTGYPYGLKGEEIPLGARILSAIDSLHAMVSERPYKRALPLEQAVEYLVKHAGTEFDPRVVEVIQRRYPELEVLAHSESSGSPKLPTPSTGPVASGATPAALAKINPQPADGRSAGFLGSIASARQEAQMLWELTHDLGNSLRLDETLSLFSMRLRNLVPFDAIAIYVRRGDKLIAEHASGDNFRVFSSLNIPVGEGLSGWVAESRKPVINGNPALEPGYADDPSSTSPLRSALSVPLDSLNDVVGVLTLYRTGAEAFTQDNLRVLLAISSKLGLCIENALKFQQAESSATTDYLTDLPNARSLFLHLDREIARCRRTQSSLGVMVCDLNGFKQVNDRFGHLEGNNILKQFANMLREVCREYDYVARMGGDEFVIVAPGMKREAAHERALLLNRYAQEIGERVCGERLLSISAGTSFYQDDGTDAEQLLSEADRRMYIVKQIHHAQSGDSKVESIPS